MKTRYSIFSLFILLILIFLAACQTRPTAAPPSPTPPSRTPSPTPLDTMTPDPAPLLLTPTNSSIYLPEVHVKPTSTPPSISLPVIMSAPSPTPTRVWVQIKNGEIYAPILVYHHITDGKPEGRYTVKVADFQEQMQTLRDKGYTAITVTTLAEALHTGGKLPSKPVVITFDDGNLDVYQNAYPIMHSLGFPGVFYIVSKYLNVADYMSADQLKEMIANGWEVGSHSRSHADMSKDETDLDVEINQSREDLQAALGVSIRSFAYPFAIGNERVYKKVRAFGYSNAVCTGWTNLQSKNMLYCLPRREVKNSTVMDDFLKLITDQ